MSLSSGIHTTYVQMAHGGKFFAVCRLCGCDPFPNRSELELAEADARAHGELSHIYDRQIIAEHR